MVGEDDWSDDQREARVGLSRWMSDEDDESQTRALFGYAGTGKTELIKALVSRARGRWLFAALTGKAAHVMARRGCEGAATLHSIIYRPAGEDRARQLEEMRVRLMAMRTLASAGRLSDKELRELERDERLLRELSADRSPRFALWPNSPLAASDVRGIVVDEVSMVDATLGRHVESFNKKILVVGDPFQLPPVRKAGYFTEREPDYMLTTVHRQAAQSGVLALATFIREGGRVRDFTSRSDAAIARWSDSDRIDALCLGAEQILCGTHRTRRELNRRVRALSGRSGVPRPGDRLVCLRNDRDLGLFNGSQWVVLDADCRVRSMTADFRLESEDEPGRVVEVGSWLHHMASDPSRAEELRENPDRRDLMEFDWGHVLTIHKSQGSQWRSVVVFDESSSFRGQTARLLYTAVTRASEQVTVVI